MRIILPLLALNHEFPGVEIKFTIGGGITKEVLRLDATWNGIRHHITVDIWDCMYAPLSNAQFEDLLKMVRNQLRLDRKRAILFREFK